jgi:putative FmdB family regulatory protein
MPLYEYRCAGCGAEFERYVSGAAATVACPACASPDVKRKLSLFALKAAGPSLATPGPAGGACCSGGCTCH